MVIGFELMTSFTQVSSNYTKAPTHHHTFFSLTTRTKYTSVRSWPILGKSNIWRKYVSVIQIILRTLGSGCGSVGKAEASDARGPRFESSHRRNFMTNMFSVNCWNDEKNTKRGREWPIFNITHIIILIFNSRVALKVVL